MTYEEEQQMSRLSEDYSMLKVKYWEIVHQINNKGILLQIEVERERSRKKDEQIKALEEQVVTLKKKQAERAPEVGSWVSQATHQKVHDRLKEALIENRKLMNNQIMIK